jgi:tetratricopeptide (TPR) repeat protein
MFRTVLELSEPGSVDEAWLTTRLGGTLVFANGDPEEIRQLFEHAVESATRMGDEHLLDWALGRWPLAAWLLGAYEYAAEYASRAIRHASLGEDWDLQVHCYSWKIILCLAFGNIEQDIELIEEAAEKSRKPARLTQATNFIPAIAAASGDWDYLSNQLDESGDYLESFAAPLMAWWEIQTKSGQALMDLKGVITRRIEFGAYGPPGLLLPASLRCWIDADLESGLG